MILRSFDGKIIQNDFDNDDVLKCVSFQKHAVPLWLRENGQSETIPGPSLVLHLKKGRKWRAEAGASEGALWDAPKTKAKPLNFDLLTGANQTV